ncbi:MAG: 50S ribosomal protein L22 [bacterium]|nr:50S ribosomal protein L22 [bacterium]
MTKTIKTIAKNVRISPRKLRLVVKMVKDMPISQLVDHLSLMPNKAARILYKTLKTALADASHNFDLSKDKLKLDHIRVDEGMVMKRWRAISRGRAHAYKKRTSHLTIVLKEAD